MMKNPKATARVTNKISSAGFTAFNRWGGISYEDILSNYPQDIIDKVWWSLSRYINENYQMGKGTFIKGFGTFTLSSAEYSLEGTTNQYVRDKRARRPVFLVSPEFVEYLLPGQYNQYGLNHYTQKYNEGVPIVKMNYALCSYGVNISKEECYTILTTMYKVIADQIRRGVFREKVMPELGTLVIRGKIFGMRFFNDALENNKFKKEQMTLLKKNLNLAMETKQSIGVRQRDIIDIDDAERIVRPAEATITHISPSGDKWLQNNLGVDVKKIRDPLREDLTIPNPKFKSEYLLDQRYYREYPKQNLKGLLIPQDIIEGIIKYKYLIMREMQVYDRHGDGIIGKFEFINAFKKANVHYKLGVELIEKIVNAYVGTDTQINSVRYKRLVDDIVSDLNVMVKEEYSNFPIDKYKGTIREDNQRARSAYAFTRYSGNLSEKALSTTNNYGQFIKTNPRMVIGGGYK